MLDPRCPQKHYLILGHSRRLYKDGYFRVDTHFQHFLARQLCTSILDYRELSLHRLLPCAIVSLLRQFAKMSPKEADLREISHGCSRVMFYKKKHQKTERLKINENNAEISIPLRIRINVLEIQRKNMNISNKQNIC